MNIKPFPGDPRYSVSDTGDVYGVNGRQLKASPDARGYRAVDVGRRSSVKRQMRKVHQMVMETFVGPRPDGMETLHINGDKLDNRLVNLRYGTKSENGHDSVRHGTHPWASRTHCPQGHEYAPRNTYIGKRGDGRTFRMCRTCCLARSAKGGKRRSVA